MVEMSVASSATRTRTHELEFFLSRRETYSASLDPDRKTEMFSSVLPVSAWFTSYPMAWTWSVAVGTKPARSLELLLPWWPDSTASLYLGGGSECESNDLRSVDFDDDEEKRGMLLKVRIWSRKRKMTIKT
jgi:hypothetical protein